MIKRLVEYLVIERRIKYIQYESSLKSNNTRNCTNYSTLKAISIKISTFIMNFRMIIVHKKNENFLMKLCLTLL